MVCVPPDPANAPQDGRGCRRTAWDRLTGIYYTFVAPVALVAILVTVLVLLFRR